MTAKTATKTVNTRKDMHMQIDMLKHRLNLRNVIIDEQRRLILILRDELRAKKSWWKIW